jgi:hypothetical protein
MTVLNLTFSLSSVPTFLAAWILWRHLIFTAFPPSLSSLWFHLCYLFLNVLCLVVCLFVCVWVPALHRKSELWKMQCFLGILLQFSHCFLYCPFHILTLNRRLV